MTRIIPRAEFVQRAKDKQRDRQRKAKYDLEDYRQMIEEQKRKGLWRRYK